MICPQHGMCRMVCLGGQTKVRRANMRTSKSHGDELGETCLKGQYVVEESLQQYPGMTNIVDQVSRRGTHRTITVKNGER